MIGNVSFLGVRQVAPNGSPENSGVQIKNGEPLVNQLKDYQGRFYRDPKLALEFIDGFFALGTDKVSSFNRQDIKDMLEYAHATILVQGDFGYSEYISYARGLSSVAKDLPDLVHNERTFNFYASRLMNKTDPLGPKLVPYYEIDLKSQFDTYVSSKTHSGVDSFSLKIMFIKQIYADCAQQGGGSKFALDQLLSLASSMESELPPPDNPHYSIYYSTINNYLAQINSGSSYWYCL